MDIVYLHVSIFIIYFFIVIILGGRKPLHRSVGSCCRRVTDRAVNQTSFSYSPNKLNSLK